MPNQSQRTDIIQYWQRRSCHRIALWSVGISFCLGLHSAYGQDITGDLNTNTNISDATVESNNVSESNTYNGAGSSPGSQPPPSAISPTIIGGGGQDSCLIPKTGGIQVSLFGFSFGGMSQDEECNRRKDARLLGTPQQIGGMGLQVSGISVMCGNAEVFRAMALANTPCPIMDIDKGQLLVGRAAFEKMRDNPREFVIGYKKEKTFWNQLLRIGKELTDVEKTIDARSVSERYRTTRTRRRNNR
tara:strand:+ start:128 stop:862 length:735 start_codon:yes stop_codon:yes gene_type:complete